MMNMRAVALTLLFTGFCCGNLPPEFISDLSPPIVREDTPVGTAVITLVGRDPEDTPLTYGLQGTSALRVDPVSGVVTIAESLDREDKDTIRLVVSVEDEVAGGDNNVVRVPLDLVVIDVNDNPPVFSRKSFEAAVPEDAEIGSTVLAGILLSDVDQVGESLSVKCILRKEDGSAACSEFSVVPSQVTPGQFRGHLILRQAMSYADKNQYDLSLQATDGDNEVTVPLTIVVKDVQNRPPVFHGSTTGIVSEDAPIGSLILTVQASDGDSGNPRKITYELDNNLNGFFLLDPDSGELRTAKPLDREALAYPSGLISLSVTAYEVDKRTRRKDESAQSKTKLSITIRDVNDEPPTFNQKEYRVSVPENLPAGTPISDLNMTVRDTDSGKNSIFNVRLADASGRFSIEPEAATGSSFLSVRVARGSLDYENPNERNFILLVVAEETRTSSRLSSTATIHVSVTDVNDNAPMFPQEAYTALVSETASPGTLVTTIKAQDRDTGSFGNDGLVYSIFGNGAERFSIDASSGDIVVAACDTSGKDSCLDYETRSTYFLTVEAIDNNGTEHKSHVPIRISLKDENDNSPRFDRSVYRAIVPEGSASFDPPLIIKASDADVSSKVKYSLIGGDLKNLFAIDSHSGRISIKDKDGIKISETEEQEIVLTVEASDGVGSHTAKVRIAVQDVNNNRPLFSKSYYEASVQENSDIGTVVEEVSATDADSHQNAEITYSILKGGYDDFAIHAKNGTVTIVRKLSFDSRNFYSIEVVASDGGIPQLSSSVFLNISILDNNNKSPYFVPTTQRIMINEDITPGTVVYNLKAADLDTSSEDKLVFEFKEIVSAVDKEGDPLEPYQLHSLDKIILITPTGGVVIQEALNRNVTTELTLAVTVTDTTAINRQVGRGYLVATIVDVNDHPPVFPPPWSLEAPFIRVKVVEELPIGSVITSVSASDLDSNIDGYEMLDNPSLTIDHATGVVTVSGRLDYEKEKVISATIIVRDTGAPQMTATASLIVMLENINDEEPIFDNPIYDATVLEHSPPGTEVLTVKATDRDKGHLGTITYSLAGDHKQYFTINSAGQVLVAAGAELDREKLSELRIRAVATDSGPEDTRRQSSVPIHITVLDVNDHLPKFIDKLFIASITENLPLRPPVPVLKVKAVDEDVGDNAALNYQIVGGSGKDMFEIEDATGIIYPSKHISAPEVKTYSLTVEVRDLKGKGKVADTANVEITVMPQNENKPVFVVPAYSNFKVKIPEMSSKDEITVMKVSARDRDEGYNGIIRYHLRVGDDNVQETPEFKIDPVTGVLSTRRALDREITAQYQIVLVAKDQGTPISYESLRVITVELEDVDDHQPRFSEEMSQWRYAFYLRENKPPNTHVGQVQAEDADSGKNSRIFYYIFSGNTNKNFYIDKSNGNIFTSKSLDREEIDSYNLLIKASNDANLNVDELQQNVDSTVARVIVNITDENDTPPKFKDRIFYAGVPQYAEVDRLVRMVTAEDSDSGRNGSVTYSIRSSTFYRPGKSKKVGSIVPSPFNITKEGKLLTATLMGPYRHHRFLLEIMAKEEAPPHRADYCQVNIWVWEKEDLIKVVLEQRPEEVITQQNIIADELSSILEGTAVVDEIRYYMYDNSSVSKTWAEMLIHVVNSSSQVIPSEQVLKNMDRGYSMFGLNNRTAKIRHIYPVLVTESIQSLDARVAGLIALVVALFLGFVTFMVVCCCLRYWAMTPAKSREHLIHRTVDDDLGLNTTENPLWLDQKLKTYEEQELSMHVLSEFDASIANGTLANGGSPHNLDTESNTYATIQKSYGGTVRSIQLRSLQEQGEASLRIGEEPGESNDYATLDNLRWPNEINRKRGPRVPGVETPLASLFNPDGSNSSIQELVTSFTGSTFQPPDMNSMANRPLPDEPLHNSGIPNKHIGDHEEPCLIAELI